MHHEYLNALMDQFDTNKDGNLDRDEIKRMLQIILRDGANSSSIVKAGSTSCRRWKTSTTRASWIRTATCRSCTRPRGGAMMWSSTRRCRMKTWTSSSRRPTRTGTGCWTETVLASLALWTRLMKMAEPEEPASGFSRCVVGWARSWDLDGADGVRWDAAVGPRPGPRAGRGRPQVARRGVRFVAANV